jgi:UDPglucose 6-dehydrogenase
MRNRTQIPFDIVSNPEFLREGQALEDFMKPGRVVIGAEALGAAQEIAALYEPFVLRGAPVLFMDSRSAEMVKYAANAMLACRISFMNEIANACEHLHADINSVRNAVGMDGRIGPAFLYPGVGYGGSCFPKDVSALAWISSQAGYRMDMVEATAKVNNQQARRFCDKVVRFFCSDLVDILESALHTSEPIPRKLSNNKLLLSEQLGSLTKRVLAERNIAVWGLSFKPRTDDMRDAPSSKIIPYLLELGANVTAYDPVASDRAREVLPEGVRYASDPYDALEDTDALLLLTEWNLFRHPDFERMKKRMRLPVIFDGRNQYSRQELLDKGFVYFGVGH